MRYADIQLAILFIFSCLFVPLSYAQNLSPESIAGAITIDEKKAKPLFEQGMLFVDVRKDSDWEAGRIPGAIHLYVKTDFTEAKLLQFVNKDDPLVIYCNGPKCFLSSRAVRKAVQWGFKHIYYFRTGFPSWRAANLPVE